MMPHASQPLFASATPCVANVLMEIAGRLAVNMCPSCGQPTIRIWRNGHRKFCFHCSSCRFTLADESNEASHYRYNPVQAGFTADVSQALLFGLYMARSLRGQEAALRQEILTRIDQGARIESGSLRLEIHESVRTSITNDLIERILGSDVLQSLQFEAPKSVVKQVLLLPY